MGLQKFANNAFSTIDGAITDSDTSISVQTGDGVLFPTITTGEYFYCTLVDDIANPTKIEIIKVTVKSTDTFTVTRNIEDVSGYSGPYAFSDDAIIDLRFTASSILPNGHLKFVATGAITSGSVVGLRSDGTIEIIDDDTTTASHGAIYTALESTNAFYTLAIWDKANSRVVIISKSSNDTKGYCIIGSISGTVITFGTAVSFTPGGADQFGIAYDDVNEKILVTYQDENNSSYGTGIVGTISGLTVSFGTPAVFFSGTVYTTSCCYDSNSGNIVVAYRGTDNYGYARVATISGTTVSYGTEEQFSADNIAMNVEIAADSVNNKVLVAYEDYSQSNYQVVQVGTVSGTDITFGSTYILDAGNSGGQSSLAFSTSDGVFLISYMAGTDSDNLYIRAASISGTTVSFGTPVEYNNAAGVNLDQSVRYDTFNDIFILSYRETEVASGYCAIREVFITGTTIDTVSDYIDINYNTRNPVIAIDDTTGKIVIAYENAINGDVEAAVFTPTDVSTNANTTIGIAAETISDATSGIITTLSGVNDQQSSLTIGTLYYVQYDGTITATPNPSYDYKSLGRAIATDKLLIERLE